MNGTAEDVVRVARTVGVARATDPETLRNLFCAKLEGALGTAIRGRDDLASFASLDELRDRVLELVGHDLNGYVVDDLAFTHFEHTPVSELDEGNILDARGIEKITTLASAARVSAAEAKRVALRKLLEHHRGPRCARHALCSLRRPRPVQICVRRGLRPAT